MIEAPRRSVPKPPNTQPATFFRILLGGGVSLFGPKVDRRLDACASSRPILADAERRSRTSGTERVCQSRLAISDEIFKKNRQSNCGSGRSLPFTSTFALFPLKGWNLLLIEDEDSFFSKDSTSTLRDRNSTGIRAAEEAALSSTERIDRVLVPIETRGRS